jgi:hypothetical protein
MTKKELDGENPPSNYLVVEDPEQPSTWHLRVKGIDGKPDHRLMGAAWAALHGGFRGNKYEGPQKAEAIAKLKALYKAEGLTVPEGASDPSFLERRMCPVSEMRVDGNRNPVLGGYAAVFNSLSIPIFNFRERIAPGAFRRTLETKPDVRALINHDSNLVLGRTTSGTLTVGEDAKGLAVRVELPSTSYALDLAESVRRGDVNQMSIGFRIPKGGDEIMAEDGGTVRELRDIDLIDVSAVTFPAYTQTRVEIRSYIKFLEGQEHEEREAPEPEPVTDSVVTLADPATTALLLRIAATQGR